MSGFIGERIGRFHHGEPTYRSRMDDSARSRLPRWKTRLSKAVAAVLNVIYEEDFLGFS